MTKSTHNQSVRLVKSQPNPNGLAETELFLLEGDVTSGPVEHIKADPAWALHQSTVDTRRDPFRLRVLHFNDLHGFISKINPHGDEPVFSRMASYVSEVRQRYRDDPNVTALFAAGGDEQVGSLFDELVGQDKETYQIHAGYHAYSAAGVDVGVLGNHDVDKGSALLAHAIDHEARFPLLSANVISPHLRGLCYPAALFRLKEVRIGLIGLSTMGQIKCYEADFIMANPLTTLKNLLPAFKPFCDILIILSHLGYSADSGMATVKPLGDVELARALDYCEVDLIVGGHTHHALNEEGLGPANVVNGIPIAQAGSLGRYLGSVDITLRDGTAAVSSVRLLPVTDLPVEQTFEARVVQPLLKQAHAICDTHLGVSSDDPALRTVTVSNNFAVRELALVNFITDAIVTRCRLARHPVDLAMVDAADIHAGLEEGPTVTLGQWLHIMPFADTIQLFELTGQQLKALLDDNAKRVDLAGEPHLERGFAHFSSAVRYTLKVVGRDRNRNYADQITIYDRPLDDHLEKRFTIACSSFFRRACRAWEVYALNELKLSLLTVDPDEQPRFDTGLLLSQALIAHIRERGGVTPKTGARLDGRLKVVMESSAAD